MNEIITYFRQGCLLFAGVCVFLGCSVENIQPLISIPGYKTVLQFSDSFDADLGSWVMEGSGYIEISEDNRLQTTLLPESPGVMVWLKRHFDIDFLLEYDIDLSLAEDDIDRSQTAGHCWIFFCATGLDNKDILKNANRSGTFESYTDSEIQSYHISYHCFNSDGVHISGNHVRKNPYNNLLSANEIDPCMENRKYTIHVAKTSDRIQFYVDGILIHDVRDGSNYKDIHKNGKIGFWFQGSEEETTLFLDNVRVFKLSPSR